MNVENGSGGGGGGAEEHAVVECTTTAGPITMHLYRAWSPHGYDRATELFERRYYDQSHFFRVVPHFLVQFGISYTHDEELKRFADSQIQDDPKREDLLPFREGMMSFAGSGPNSRTSQLFIAYDRAGGLGTSPWETPFGEVVVGVDNVRSLYAGYGDMPPWGKGPQQGPIRNRGSSYIEDEFPLLDKFKTCTVKRTESTLEDKNQGVVDELGEGDVGAMRDDKVGEEEFDATRGIVEDRHSMRGLKMKAKPRKHHTANIFPKNKDGGVEAGEKKSALFGKCALIVVFVILALLLSRRKKSKQAEKSV